MQTFWIWKGEKVLLQNLQQLSDFFKLLWSRNKNLFGGYFTALSEAYLAPYGTWMMTSFCDNNLAVS